jgi:predicted heme/steroid binding protein/uncharacterized membrane protein
VLLFVAIETENGIRRQGTNTLAKNEFDSQDLSQFDGQSGKPIYVAYDGKVFNLSNSPLWREGVHIGMHQAGLDLTKELQAAPHGPEKLDEFPVEGLLKTEKVPEPSMPEVLSRLLKRFPFLQRHPHPMLVHFPIVFMSSTFVFAVLFFFTGKSSFEHTAFHCLAGGVLFLPPAIATGFFSWWLNFQARPLKIITLKIWLSVILLILGSAALLMRLMQPDILTPLREISLIYLALVLCFPPLVMATGWYGAKLTFPFEKE